MKKILSLALITILAVLSCQKEPKVVNVTAVTLNTTSLEMTEGDAQPLTATVFPENADNKKVLWTSSDASVATVSNGMVTAVKPGYATITATSDDGGKTASCTVIVKAKVYPVVSVSLDKATLTLTEGDSETLTAIVKPDNATNKTMTWSSSDKTVATVENGKVTAVKTGTATITVKTEDGGKTASCTVTVKAKTYPVTGVSLDKTSLTLTEGDNETLTATISPDNATNKNVTWSSSNTSVATVSNGKVTAVKAGTATITVTTDDGSKTATCTVTVKEKTYPVTGVSLNRTSLALIEGESESLTATISPSNATNKNVTWSSSDASVATVSDGKVTAMKAGTATITVTTEDGGITATCSIKVEELVEYVDLGLSVKWATCNIGASKPWESGGHYQWAGTEDVTDQSVYWDNCPYHTGRNLDSGWTKYSGPDYWSGSGSADNKKALDPEDDVAHVKLGGNWRMPTIEEWNELINTSNCSLQWTSINGVYGYKIKSKKTGFKDNWIFLPAAGYRTKDELIASDHAAYWSKSLWNHGWNSITPDAWGIKFHNWSTSPIQTTENRYYGLSVRPVLK